MNKYAKNVKRLSTAAIKRVCVSFNTYLENPLNVTILIRSKLTTPIRSKLTGSSCYRLTENQLKWALKN